MSNSDRIEMEGVIVQKLKGDNFKVRLSNGVDTTGTISGKLRMNSIRLCVGDKVTVDLSTYDLTKCRIIWRERTISTPQNTF